MKNKRNFDIKLHKLIIFIRAVLDLKYFTKIALLILIFLILMVIWLTRYSYTASVDPNNQLTGWRVNNFTGEACVLSLKLQKGFGINTYKLKYDFSNCLEIEK